MKLYIVVPCYNEEEVLRETTARLAIKLNDLINELDINYNPNVDITCLVTDLKQGIDLKELVKLSLRYCPDYVVLAEARGAEFEDVLTSSLSGIDMHPVSERFFMYGLFCAVPTAIIL